MDGWMYIPLLGCQCVLLPRPNAWDGTTGCIVQKWQPSQPKPKYCHIHITRWPVLCIKIKPLQNTFSCFYILINILPTNSHAAACGSLATSSRYWRRLMGTWKNLISGRLLVYPDSLFNINFALRASSSLHTVPLLWRTMRRRRSSAQSRWSWCVIQYLLRMGIATREQALSGGLRKAAEHPQRLELVSPPPRWFHRK